MITRFTRKYNRTTKDIFGAKFQERVKMQLQGATQKIAHYCKHNHTWQNRTGALEESINFTPPELKGNMWASTVFAGGWAKVKYATMRKIRQLKGQKYISRQRKKNIGYQRGQAFQFKRGMGRLVNYAYWVEKKGFPVLIQGIEHYRPLLARIFANNLKIEKIGLGK